MRRRMIPAILTTLALLGPACNGNSTPADKQDSKAKADAPAADAPSKQADADVVEKKEEPAMPTPAGPEAGQAEAPPVPTDAAGTTGTEAVATGKAPVYEVISEGAEPRKQLRYAPPAGQSEIMALTMGFELALDFGGVLPAQNQKLPESKMFSRSEVQSVADGKIAYKVVFDRYEMGQAADAQQEMIVAAMTQAWESIKGYEQMLTMDARGNVLDGSLKMPEGVAPALAQNIENLNRSVEQAMITWPEQAVGVGAKWKEITEISNQGVKLEQTAENEVTAIDGDTITVSTTITQKPVSKDLTMPGMPEGATAKLTEFDSKGQGRTIYDLGHIVPREGESSVETKLGVEASAGGQTQKITTTIKLTIKLERAEDDQK